MTDEYIRAGDALLRRDHVVRVDCTDIEQLKVVVWFIDDYVGRWIKIPVEGLQAIDVVMALKPGALENRRLRWVKHAWMVHNLVGHPVMQLLAFVGQYKAAMWVHDATVPRPRGKR